MANDSPVRVTKAVRQQAALRLQAMDLEIAALNLISAADQLRSGNPAGTAVQRAYSRVRQAMSGLAETAA